MHSLAQCAAAPSVTAPAMRALRCRSRVSSAARSSPSLQAAAASQATAALCSTATSMSASACFTAWNWPMGRPNWTRTLAYSDAVSRHQRAIPALSAAANVRARPRTSSSETSTCSAGATVRPPSAKRQLSHRTRGVERRQRLHRDGVAQRLPVEQDPACAHAGAVVERHQDQPCRREPEHRAHGARQDERSALRLAARAARPRPGPRRP